MSSTSLAVSSDSMRPTRATPTAYGPMSVSVSSVSGTSGKTKPGRLVGSSPWSATSGMSQRKTTTSTVMTRIVMSGAGTTSVSLGHRSMMTTPSATRG